MGAEVIVGTAVAGTVLEIAGNRKAAKDQQAALKEQANLKRAQAANIMERFEMNRNIMRREGSSFAQGQLEAFAKGGVDIGSGATLVALENTYRTTQEAIRTEQFEAESSAAALMAGASLDEKTGKRIRSAERISRVGTLLRGASSAAQGAK